MSSAFEDSQHGGMVTSTVTVPVGLRGINAFSTPEWWSASSTHDSGSAQYRWTDQPASVVAQVRHRLAPVGSSCVLMITRPLVDWLPGAAPGEAGADWIPVLSAWADSVLAWTEVAPVQMAMTRASPRTVSDLLAAATGQSSVADSEDDSPGDAAATFRTAISQRLQRSTSSGGLERFWSRAAIEAVAAATHPPVGHDAALRAASVDILTRLTSGGVRIHGPRTALVWPQQAERDLPLDVAAEASLAVLFAALDDLAATSGDSPDRNITAADRRRLEERLQAAQRDVAGRRSDPRNLRRVRLRSLVKRLVLGRNGG